MKLSAKAAEKKSLLDEDDSSSGSESSASDSGAHDTQLKVNKRYARAFQERKQLEELQRVRYREEGLDSDDSSSEEEDDDGRLLTGSVNLKFLKLMKALRKKDDTIYDKSARFFDEEESNETEDKGEKKDKVKKVKDVLREQILEKMDEDGADKSDERDPSQSKFAYDAQQEEIRKSFLKTAGGSDDDESDDNKEDWMVIKTRKEPSLEEKEALNHFEEIEEITKQQSEKNTTIDPRGEVKDGDKFLIDFLKQKKWIDKDGDFGADDDSIDDLDKADDYEANYNFRFEQAEAAATSGATLSVQTYARGNTMTTVRRTDTTRKEKRESRKERKAAERKAKEEQLKRLKNAKQQEANKKLAQIKSVLGSVDQETVDEAAIMKMLEGDYDPEQFEKAMNAAYSDDFYEKEDEEWKTDLDVREGLKGDEDGEAIVGDDVEGGMYDTQGAEEDEEDEYDDTEGDQQAWGDDEEIAEGEEDENPETELEKKVKRKMQEELYKLDYEDIVAGMPTRFKYRQVEKNDYGLDTHEILLARDSNLKQFVSLKKMAPYTEDGEHHVGSKKRRRFRDALKDDLEEYKEQEEAAVEEEDTAEQNEAENNEEPKKKKRRRLKKGKKRDSESMSAGNTEKMEPEVIPEKEATGIKKRRRKKKGKKGESFESYPPDDSEKTEDSVGYQPPSENIADEKKTKTPGSSEDKKKRKKKKKKKKEAMGLSASRLSSYGL